MKPIILTILLVTLSAPTCLGEWTEVSESKDGGDSIYIDFESVQRKGESVNGETIYYVYFWSLTNYSEATLKMMRERIGQEIEFVSIQAYTQVDCSFPRSKRLQLNSYPQPMGKGTALYSSDVPDQNWTHSSPVTSNTPKAFELKEVCVTM